MAPDIENTLTLPWTTRSAVAVLSGAMRGSICDERSNGTRPDRDKPSDPYDDLAGQLEAFLTASRSQPSCTFPSGHPSEYVPFSIGSCCLGEVGLCAALGTL